MKIKVYKDNNQIFIENDGQKESFSFETMDKLIDLFVNEKDVQFDDCEESLVKYKDLLQKVYIETQKESFKNAYAELAKTDITNEELLTIIKNNQIEKNK